MKSKIKPISTTQLPYACVHIYNPVYCIKRVAICILLNTD